MWLFMWASLKIMKLVIPFYYVGKEKVGNKAYVRFGKSALFCTRANSQDAIPLNEIWKHNCYSKAAIRKGNLVVDIGAHIGGYSVLASKLGGKVFAYEAEPNNYELLVKNLRLNGCRNVKSNNVAVSSTTGKIILNVDKRGSGLHSIYASDSDAEKITVPSISLHDLFTKNKLAKIDVMKIDVEGSEYEILLSATAEDLRKIQTLIIEYHDYFDHGHNKRELEVALRKNGFIVRDITPWYQRLLLKFGLILATQTMKPKQQPL